MSTSNEGSQSNYTVLLEPRAKRDLDDLEGADFRRIDARIQSLAEDPRPFGVEKLAFHTYRIRVGDWRVIYLVQDDHRRIVVGRVKRRNERTYK